MSRMSKQLVDAWKAGPEGLEVKQLRVENAKLREFVLTLAFCANDEADCDQCPMNGVRCDVVQQCFCDGAAETLRELGIEEDA